MKPGTNGRRPRGRPNRKQHGGQARPNNFDSGQEGRVRGNAHQVYERYLALARDAVTAGDRVASETYFQHAEHYFRVLNASTDPQPNGQNRQDRPGGDTRPEGGQQDGGRRQDHRQDGHRHAANRPDAQAPNETQGNGQPPALSQSAAPTSSPHDPATNGQDTSPAAPRQANQGGRQRRSAPAREDTHKDTRANDAPVNDTQANDGGRRGGEANQAQPQPQNAPQPLPQPVAQPGSRIDGGCEPASD